VFEKAVALATEAVNRRFAGPEPPRIIHADLHQWNVRIIDGELIPFDFEDLTWSYPIQDIATTFYHLYAHPDRQALQQAFRGGYESVASWPEAYPGELERFTIRRILDLANFMAGAPNPEDQAAAPAFLAAAAGRLRPLVDDR
jgi:Ser/Thr protein kinase RdoA (MazF antagonist)